MHTKIEQYIIVEIYLRSENHQATEIANTTRFDIYDIDRTICLGITSIYQMW